MTVRQSEYKSSQSLRCLGLESIMVPEQSSSIDFDTIEQKLIFIYLLLRLSRA
jgi:hypothetical protein